MSSRPPNGMVKTSIENSGLLITRTLHRHKHQLRDFFNRHTRSHKLAPFLRLESRHLSEMAIFQQLLGTIDEVGPLSLPPKQPIRGHRERGNREEAGLNPSVGCFADDARPDSQ